MGNTVETGKNTVLITGATGFLGEYLVRRLTKEYRVLAMGRNREQGGNLKGWALCSVRVILQTGKRVRHILRESGM